jgi:hypothetical protein
MAEDLSASRGAGRAQSIRTVVGLGDVDGCLGGNGQPRRKLLWSLVATTCLGGEIFLLRVAQSRRFTQEAIDAI